MKLSALGQALPDGGEQFALDNARAICVAAAAAGTTVTLDMEDHTTIDSTLRVLKVLREDYPWVGAVLQSMLHRTEQDCRDLAYPGSRIRLVKGAYARARLRRAPGQARGGRGVRALPGDPDGGRRLPDGGHARLADDPRGAGRRARERPAPGEDHEFQMLYGIRQDEQLKAARAGERMRVYVPFGTDWYGYFMRRLAERPANVAFFLRALIGR